MQLSIVLCCWWAVRVLYRGPATDLTSQIGPSILRSRNTSLYKNEARKINHSLDLCFFRKALFMNTNFDFCCKKMLNKCGTFAIKKGFILRGNLQHHADWTSRYYNVTHLAPHSLNPLLNQSVFLFWLENLK